MIRVTFVTIRALFVTCLLFAVACSGVEERRSQSSEVVLVASTPGDSTIKSLLHLNPETNIDFIKWGLILDPGRKKSNTFILNINFGESQPNTQGFKEGGSTLTLKGQYVITKRNTGDIKGEVYRLICDTPPLIISFVKLSENLFHLLTPENTLMVGNGGWSYTLNRERQLSDTTAYMPVLSNSSLVLNNTSVQDTFDGRTPCLGIAKEYTLQVDNDCFKIKWRLILNRDPTTMLPTTYLLKWSTSRSNDIVGNWRILENTGYPGILIYQLDPEVPENSISFLAGDENILFILDKQLKLLVGNSDFSYTLNKKSQ